MHSNSEIAAKSKIVSILLAVSFFLGSPGLRLRWSRFKPATAAEWSVEVTIELEDQEPMTGLARNIPWEVIPFFHAVYHRHAVIYGNYSSLTMPPYDSVLSHRLCR